MIVMPSGTIRTQGVSLTTQTAMKMSANRMTYPPSATEATKPSAILAAQANKYAEATGS